MKQEREKPGIMHRERLEKKLAEIWRYPLMVVTAPMGYGKSTAVRTYLDETDMQTVWIGMSFAIETGASSFFWHLLVKCLAKYQPDLAQSLAQKGFPTDSIGIYNVVEELQNFPWERESVLVIDDYQFVENNQINALMARLAAAEIPKLHIILITRKLPDLPLVELKMKGLCYVIKTGDLTFTEEEVNAYLDGISFNGGEEIRRELIECANGWITSVYLLARNWSDGFHFAPIYSMLKHSMFEQLDESAQQLLLRLSVFDIFTVEQAAYVLEQPNVGAELEKLYLDNAFIDTIGDERFCIHQIFRNFLRKECTYHAVDLTRLYLRMGDWYYGKRNYVLAYQNWLSARAYDRVLSSLEGAQNVEILPAEEKLMFQVFGYVEQEEFCRYPLSTLKYVTYLAMGGYRGVASRILEQLQEYYSDHSHPTYNRNQLQGEFHVAKAMLNLNDISCVEQELSLAKEAMGEKGSLLYNRETRPPCCTPEFSFAFFSRSGTYQDTVRRLGAALENGIQATASGAGCAELVQAEYALETGHFDQAEEMAKASIERAQRYGQDWVCVSAKFALARLYILQRRMDEAQDILDYFAYLQGRPIDPGLYGQIQASIGYLYGVLGEVENIPGTFSSGDMSRYRNDGIESAFAYLVCEKAFLLEGEYRELEKRANFFQEKYNNCGCQLGLIHHRLIMAVVKNRLQEPERGAQELEETLDLAMRDGVILPFIESAASMHELLTPEVVNRRPEFWSRVMAYVNAAAQPQQHTVGRCGLLSTREVEIMLLMEKGKRQKEIAGLLYISPNTVKKHMENIYRKLNVNNKTLALKEFQKLQRHIEPER